MQKEAGYYCRGRDDLLFLVPSDVQRVLDVGCGDGAMGRQLKERQDCHVTGIEILPEHARVASSRLDLVYCGDAANVLPLLPRAQYGCIILGDVLEHMEDPWGVLLSLSPLLSPGGQILISVPNVCHWSVVEGMVTGRWDYTGAGVLDRDHLRFFTRASFESMLSNTGLCHALAGVVRVAPEVGSAVDNEMYEPDADYQFLFRAWPGVRGVSGETTAIIIVSHNLWEQTFACLESISAHTPQDHFVIVVDNASTDKTPAGLEEYKKKHPDAWVIRSGGHLSFGQACNRGLAAAFLHRDVEYALFLNNDTVVTDGWLGRLLACLDRHPETGIVGPMSNYVAGAQKLGDRDINPAAASDIARREAGDHLGESVEVGAVVGFCLMARRAVFEDIGELDERFVNGFEETDFCLRAGHAGWASRVVKDAFIYHRGGQTFIETGADYWGGIEENYRKFVDKWPGAVPSVVDYRRGSAWFFVPKRPPHVYWAVLFEKSMPWESADVLCDVAAAGAAMKYTRIAVPHMPIDAARNQLARLFLNVALNPNDVLIMLDADHYHPVDLLERLSTREEGVVAALAFRRGPPYDPQFYMRQEGGRRLCPAEWEDGQLYECDAVGTGAIAIRRWVFDRLEAGGHHWPYFRFTYPEDRLNHGGEDFFFATCCERVGIKHYCDTGLEIPHMTTTAITHAAWKKYRGDHPEILIEERSK